MTEITADNKTVNNGLFSFKKIINLEIAKKMIKDV